jgi:prepilin-type N-terminal cleavage/methylation domain-containing protein
MKKAFTLVELIITIVIIGIAAVTIPIMMGAANKLQEDNVNQDIFFKSTVVMNDILSRAWDVVPAAEDYVGIWDVQNGDSNLSRTGTARFRVGSVSAENYRQFYSTQTNATSISTTVSQLVGTDNMTTLNDYNNKFIDEVSGDAKVRYDIGVTYVSDGVVRNGNTEVAVWNLSTAGSTTASTNLKRITITAKRSGFDDVSFVYFSSNVGTPGIKVK